MIQAEAAHPLGQVLLFAGIPAITMFAGAVLATVWVPGRRMRSLLQHFAAGVVFSVVAVELLPDFLHAHDLWAVALGFSAGVALMLLLRLTAGHPESEDGVMRALTVREATHGVAVPDRDVGAGLAEPTAAVGLVVPVAVDAVLDGALIGISLVAGVKQGALLSVALGLEMFSIGLALTTTLRAAGGTALRSSLITAGIAVLILVGALAGDSLLVGVSPRVLAGVFAFATAALLYLVTEELLVRAHAAAETAIATAMFFVGFLLFLLLGMAV